MILNNFSSINHQLQFGSIKFIETQVHKLLNHFYRYILWKYIKVVYEDLLLIFESLTKS